jgi:hypothetical protein
MYVERIPAYGCQKCHIASSKPLQKYNFSTWAGFGRLWEWARKQEWWKKFGRAHMCSEQIVGGVSHHCPSYDNIQPDNFADAVDEFLQVEHGLTPDEGSR